MRAKLQQTQQQSLLAYHSSLTPLLHEGRFLMFDMKPITILPVHASLFGVNCPAKHEQAYRAIMLSVVSQ